MVIGRVKGDTANFQENSAAAIESPFPKMRTLILRPNESFGLNNNFESGEMVDIVITEEVLLETFRHVSQDTSKELGGFLLGNRYLCPNSLRPYIVIDQFMQAEYTEGTNVSLSFTVESWAQLDDRLTGKFKGKELIGWYHSHPKMGIFLSGYDLNIHKNRFANQSQVALVMDPVKHEGGFFAWQGDEINPNEKVPFYEMLEGDSRETVVAWTNYYCEDPKTRSLPPLKAKNTGNLGINETGIAPGKAETAFVNDLLTGKASIGTYLLLGAFSLLLLGLFSFVAYSLVSWLTHKPVVTNESTKDETKTADTLAQEEMLNRLKVELDRNGGAVSSDGNITIVLKAKDISPDKAEQIRQNTKVSIDNTETNSVETEMQDYGFSIRAVGALSQDKLKKFNAGGSQPLNVLVTFQDSGVSQEKIVEIKSFNKNAERTANGNKINFGEAKVRPGETKIKAGNTDKPQTQPEQRPETQRDNTPKVADVNERKEKPEPKRTEPSKKEKPVPMTRRDGTLNPNAGVTGRTDVGPTTGTRQNPQNPDDNDEPPPNPKSNRDKTGATPRPTAERP
jgi:proteasome lid subunit RPN8/RPN11